MSGNEELPEVARVADRLQPHLEAVVAGHRHDIKLGLVEAINSKIGALTVQARGYRDPEYFKLKIFQRCGLPDNPWAMIVCEPYAITSFREEPYSYKYKRCCVRVNFVRQLNENRDLEYGASSVVMMAYDLPDGYPFLDETIEGACDGMRRS